ncbi:MULTISPECIES: M3 family oligoendopeptidase [unclassified Virgibacillus]|uniref:M3 family oligoendopeptidase n=1 Tax=unclassified Virgibacillus TaxID=2620237 RepID=UPI0024DE9613|nr:M3 family oligoendopeptidase [Virgibacillus sp. LDC-1]
MQQKVEYEPTWDLEVIFSGGSDSTEFQVYVTKLQRAMTTLETMVDQFQWKDKEQAIEGLVKIVSALEKVMKQLREVSAFVSCLSAQNVHDEKANLLVGKRTELNARMGAIQTVLKQKLVTIEEQEWEKIELHPSLEDVSFSLNEMREKAKQHLPGNMEVLIGDLAIDGYHAWGEMYNTIVGKMHVNLQENGEDKKFSVSQAANKLSHPDRGVRRYVFNQIGKAWEENAPLFSQSLNHLAGFRLQTYKHRGWESVLQEPLSINRMEKATLDAMWDAIREAKPHFKAFLDKKAALLGLDKLSMYDIGAPISNSVKRYSFTEGAQFITKHFQKFSPKMADFAQMAFQKRWIEAEDRPGKRPGGFCTSFPDSKQTRIFMTYSGTSSNIATLAHELGHAYHQHVMNEMHGLNQKYAMNVAETASTFAEMIVADASVKQAKTREEKLALLEDKIQRSIAFFMNIHARFLFEQRFYEERKQGMVSVQRLNELMLEAQKEAYHNSLEEYDPNFWASKLHFHITGVPFYNFPYTFGYLFSLGIYAYALEKGGSFEDDYIALLQDTGRMSVEDLAAKHLKVDLTKPDFWQRAIHLCVKDVEEFIAY